MCVSLVGVPYSVLLPIFASDVLHGGPHTLGFLTGCPRSRRLDQRAYVSGEENDCRAWQSDFDYRFYFRFGADRAGLVALVVALAATDDGDRIFDDAADVVEQHDHADDR